MADYIQTEFVDKRLRFFDGQFLKDQDFIDEQKYHVDRVRRYSRFLNVAGIVDGLAVAVEAKNLATVQPGTALDRQGRQVVLAKPVTVPLQDYNNQTVSLVIAYGEEPSDPQAGGGEATRFHERPYVGPRDKAPDQGADAIELAKLVVDGNGTVTSDGSVRVASGLRLPDSGSSDPGTWPALRVSDGAVSLTGHLRVSGNVAVGTAAAADRLDVGGNLRVLTGSNPLRFTSGWSGFPDGVRNQAEISNDTAGYKTLMIVGNKSNDGSTRRVSVWDRLEVNGALAVTGASSFGGRVDLGGALAVAGSSSFAGNVGIGEPSPGEKLQVKGGRLQLDGNQQIRFTDSDTTNNLKLQLWTGYGLGINGSTLFYAANGRHSWRDQNGTNERMALTTGGDGGLAVMGTGASSFAGSVGIGITPPSKRLHVEAGELRVRSGHNNVTADIGAFLAQNLTQGIGIGYNRIEAIGSDASQDIVVAPKGNGRVAIAGNVTVTGGNFTVTGGSTVGGIPLIDFQSQQQRFSGHSGSRRILTYTFTFPRPVLKAEPMLRSCYLRYANRELVQEVLLGCYGVRVAGNTVTVEVTFGLKDASGSYDDPYEGEAWVVVLALLSQAL